MVPGSNNQFLAAAYQLRNRAPHLNRFFRPVAGAEVSIPHAAGRAAPSAMHSADVVSGNGRGRACLTAALAVSGASFRPLHGVD